MNDKMVTICGRVTDFNGIPIGNAVVEIKNDKFENLYQTLSDAEGKYSLSVKEGTYLAMFVCKDYRIDNLEYWAWNIMAYDDLVINPRFDGIELYAMNAFVAQGGLLKSLRIYFRAFSLIRSKKQIDVFGLKWPPTREELLRICGIIDTPRLGEKDIVVKIDDQIADIHSVGRVRERAHDKAMIFAYLVQTSLPQTLTTRSFHQICVTAHDPETEEKGEACLFIKSQYLLRNNI